jgi:Ser-tRNA(Ala) deacylase AlaX
MTGSHTHHPHHQPCCGGHEKSTTDINDIHTVYAQKLAKTIHDLRSKAAVAGHREAVLKEADHLIKTLRPNVLEFHHEARASAIKAELEQVQFKMKEAFGTDKTELNDKEASLRQEYERALEIEAYHWFTAECAKLKQHH